MTYITHKSAIALAVIAIAGFAGTAHAELKTEGSITIQTEPKKFDQKIEAAAIAKAAEKIGDLRGSVTGDPIGEIISESDLSGDQSTSLGFPIIEERRPRWSTAPAGAVPMV